MSVVDVTPLFTIFGVFHRKTAMSQKKGAKMNLDPKTYVFG
jgi:hypothetical protein